MFWCAGSWNLTNAQLSNLKDCQNRMMRRMLGKRRPDEMELGDYIGKKWGKVTMITDNTVVITEEARTTDGELVRNEIPLKLRHLKRLLLKDDFSTHQLYPSYYQECL